MYVSVLKHGDVAQPFLKWFWRGWQEHFSQSISAFFPYVPAGNGKLFPAPHEGKVISTLFWPQLFHASPFLELAFCKLGPSAFSFFSFLFLKAKFINSHVFVKMPLNIAKNLHHSGSVLFFEKQNKTKHGLVGHRNCMPLCSFIWKSVF